MSQADTAVSHADRAILRKVTTDPVAGTMIERFDFALYGFIAPIIAITFFPEGNPVAGLLQTFAIFAVAFALRPLGGACFGMMDGRVGRRKVLARLTPETPFHAAEGQEDNPRLDRSVTARA